jgi:hypothetical protein
MTGFFQLIMDLFLLLKIYAHPLGLQTPNAWAVKPGSWAGYARLPTPQAAATWR